MMERKCNIIYMQLSIVITLVNQILVSSTLNNRKMSTGINAKIVFVTALILKL